MADDRMGLSPRSNTHRVLLITDDDGHTVDAYAVEDRDGMAVLTTPLGPYRRLHFSTRPCTADEAERWRVWREGVQHG
jgi:hypothetical protein